MSQEYKVQDVKKGNEWSSDYGTFQSYAMALEGVGEPVQINKKVPVKQEPAKGDVLYGTLETKTNKNGDEYLRFKSEKRPDGGYGQSKHESPEQQESIARLVALKASVDFYSPATEEKVTIENVLDTADKFVQWLQNTGPESQEAHPPVDREQSEKSQPARDPEFDDLEPPEDLEHLREEEGGPARNWESLGKH